MRAEFLLAILAFAGQPVRDPAAVNVCERVPGAEVAKLFGKQLKEAKPFVSKGEFSRCTYIVTSPGANDPSGYVLWLNPPEDYDELLQYTEGIVERPKGFGDDAVLFVDPGDGRAKLRLVVRKSLTLEATAADADSAKKLAKLALERLSQ